MQQRLAQLLPCQHWLVDGYQVTKAARNDSDSSSDDDSDDDDAMDAESDEIDADRRQRNAPQVDDDGFTLVGRRR